MPTPDQIAKLLDLGWAAVFLVTVVVIAIGLYRQYWVPGWVVRDRDARIQSLLEENRAWRRLYLDGVTNRGASGDHGERDDPFSRRSSADDTLG